MNEVPHSVEAEVGGEVLDLFAKLMERNVEIEDAL